MKVTMLLFKLLLIALFANEIIFQYVYFVMLVSSHCHQFQCLITITCMEICYVSTSASTLNVSVLNRLHYKLSQILSQLEVKWYMSQMRII